jgi:hypothetical protein
VSLSIYNRRGRLPRALLISIALGIFGAAPLTAQRVLGPGEDASVVPRGALRLTGGSVWSRFNERFANGLGTVAEGELEPLGSELSGELGVAAIEILRPLEGPLGSLAGLASTTLALGPVTVAMDAVRRTTPFTLEFGLTNRLTLSALVPYVTTRNEVVVNANGTREAGNMGINPALDLPGAVTINSSVVTQLQSAATTLQAALDGCVNVTTPECNTLNANRPSALQLITQSTGAAATIAAVYGTSTTAGALFAPRHGSALHTAISTRLGAFSTQYQALLGAPTSGTEWIGSRPVGAPPVGWTDFQRFLTDPAFGMEVANLELVERSHLGDVELGGKFLLFDNFGTRTAERLAARGLKTRVSLGAVYRLGSGQLDRSNELADIATGDGLAGIEGRVFLDVLAGRRFWTSVIARYGTSSEDEIERRVTETPNDPYPPQYRQQIVTRKSGNRLQLDVWPRLAFNDAFALGAYYGYRSKAEDEYRGTFTVQDLTGTEVTLDAAVLGLGTEQTESRIGGGATFSTVAAYDRRKARWPLELELTHFQTLSGTGRVPKQFITSITLRIYRPLVASR